jgi:predicted membrane channel-forming protein YqfA (hemolysin III family)
MKTVIILSILIGIVSPIVIYKRKRDLKQLFTTLFLLSALVALWNIGTVMRSLPTLHFIHLGALVLSYISYIVYILIGRLYWYIYFLPFGTLLLYIFLAFIGNRHISGF